jgi:hypothetical protein
MRTEVPDWADKTVKQLVFELGCDSKEGCLSSSTDLTIKCP